MELLLIRHVIANNMDALNPDAMVHVSERLCPRDIAVLAASSRSLHQAIDSNERLWSRLYQRMHPWAWGEASEAGRQASVPGGWRALYRTTHVACQQLCASGAATRKWTIDTNAISLAALHASAGQRLVLTAGGSVVELKCQQAQQESVQLCGHTGRISCAEVIDLGGGGGRIGVISGSADQTVRLWVKDFQDDEEGGDSQPLTLLTPSRTLRGHTEGVTCLAVSQSQTGTGVTIAATGAKDRTIRLWGLAPLVPSPVGKGSGGQIATLRGHGAPVTAVLHSDEGLLSASLDGRLKAWDVWRTACSGTVKCGVGPISVAQLAVGAGPFGMAPCVFVGGEQKWQAVDTRAMTAAAAGKQSGTLLCLTQRDTTLVTGGAEGACVWDLRSPAQPRMQLRGHGGPVSGCHVDRYKIVTSSRMEEAVRVWHPDDGECLAVLEESGDGPEGPGITAMACKGAVIVTGNAEGVVRERDFSQGGPPARDAEGICNLGSKFWQLNQT